MIRDTPFAFRFYAAYFALPSQSANGKYAEYVPSASYFTKPKICSPKIKKWSEIVGA